MKIFVVHDEAGNIHSFGAVHGTRRGRPCSGSAGRRIGDGSRGSRVRDIAVRAERSRTILCDAAEAAPRPERKVPSAGTAGHRLNEVSSFQR
jgi:hypothetical protein